MGQMLPHTAGIRCRQIRANEEALMRVTPKSCQSQPGPSQESVQKTNPGQKDIPNILKVDSGDLKEPQKWPEVGQGWRGHGLAGKKWALSREHFQDLCQGHSQDVYPLMVGV